MDGKIQMKLWFCFFSFLALLVSISANGEEGDNPYLKCIAQTKDQDACLDKVGRDYWAPYKLPEDCIVVKEILEAAEKAKWQFSYKVLFFNERCKFLRQPHFERKASGS